MEKFDEEQASAAVPVASVVTGDGVVKVADRMRLRAYISKGKHGMNLTRAFLPTIKGFNADYGQKCRSWADVVIVAERLLKESE